MSTAALESKPTPESAKTHAKPAGTTGYEVARPMGRCRISDRLIEPGEKFMAALIESHTGFERADVSNECWESFDRTNVLAYWQAVMPKHDAKKKVFVDDSVLCDLFERLADTTDEPKLHFRFVLGLVLMRKRLVIYDTTEHVGDAEIWKVRLKGRDQSFDLLNPKLNEQQVVEVSQQLGQILNEDL